MRPAGTAPRHYLQVTDLDGGVVYVVVVPSFLVLGHLLPGWTSNSKDSLPCAIRSCAELISYEISLAMITWILHKSGLSAVKRRS